jgi:hypothetical protein
MNYFLLIAKCFTKQLKKGSKKMGAVDDAKALATAATDLVTELEEEGVTVEPVSVVSVQVNYSDGTGAIFPAVDRPAGSPPPAEPAAGTETDTATETRTDAGTETGTDEAKPQPTGQ